MLGLGAGDLPLQGSQKILQDLAQVKHEVLLEFQQLVGTGVFETVRGGRPQPSATAQVAHNSTARGMPAGRLLAMPVH